MANRETSYIPLKQKHDVTHLRIDVYYNIGDYSMLSHQPQQRGYYLSVSPVGISTSGACKLESYGFFTGIKKLILPVSRQSAKRFEEAKLLAEEIKPQLIACVLQEQGLELQSENQGKQE